LQVSTCPSCGLAPELQHRHSHLMDMYRYRCAECGWGPSEWSLSEPQAGAEWNGRIEERRKEVKGE